MAQRVNVIITWEADFDIDVEDLTGEWWDPDVPLTASAVLDVIRAHQRGRPYRIEEFVKDGDLLDPRDIVIDLTVSNDGTTRATWRGSES